MVVIWFGFVLFGWVGFYGISTNVVYLMPNPIYIYIKYMISKHILPITFLNELSFCTTRLHPWS